MRRFNDMTIHAYDHHLNYPPDPNEPIEYPETDGAPMAESDYQLIWLLYLIQAFKAYFSDDPQTYAAGNLFVYYEEGDPKAVVSPDVFVVRGIENKLRTSYKVWEEGKTPDLVIEITSKSTSRVDQTEKLGVYAFLGVKEYILFDPRREYLDPPIKFYRLANLGYKVVEPLTDPDSSKAEEAIERYMSKVTGLEFHYFSSNGEVRLFDPANQRYLGTYAEVDAEREAEREAKEAEREAKEAAQSEIEALKAEIRRLKGESN
ncbi:MAG: Uma2 family endonuclease [Chloroflexota bacterium]